MGRTGPEATVRDTRPSSTMATMNAIGFHPVVGGEGRTGGPPFAILSIDLPTPVLDRVEGPLGARVNLRSAGLHGARIRGDLVIFPETLRMTLQEDPS